MHGLSSSWVSFVLVAIILVFIIWRQLQERPVKEERGFGGLFIVGAIGLVQLFDYVQIDPKSFIFNAVLFLVFSLLLAVLLGWLRARYMHIWRDKGQLMRQGNVGTILLWALSIALHYLLDILALHLPHGKAIVGLASASVVLHIALSLGVQQYVVLQRAKRVAR